MSSTLGTTPKREAARTELGTSEHLELRLSGHGYACPHFPKFRARELGFPSCLGFFRENDKDKIIYVELSKLCEKCCSEVVPNSRDYNVWISDRPPQDMSGKLSGVPLKEYSIWDVPEPSKGLYREFIQAGTPLRKRECIGTTLRESTPRGLFNLPTIIKMPHDAAEEEAWSWLKKSGKPFYIEHLHLVKRRTPWVEKVAMEDFWIARKYGNYTPSSPKAIKKKGSVPSIASSFLTTSNPQATGQDAASRVLPTKPISRSIVSRNDSVEHSNGSSSIKSNKKSALKLVGTAAKPQEIATTTFHDEDVEYVTVPSVKDIQKVKKAKPFTARVITAKDSSPNAIATLDHEQYPLRNELQSMKQGPTQEGGPMITSLDVPFVDFPANEKFDGSIKDLRKTTTIGKVSEPGSKLRDKALPNIPVTNSSSLLSTAKPSNRKVATSSSKVREKPRGTVVLSQRYGIVSPIPLGSPENFVQSQLKSGIVRDNTLQNPPIFQQLLQGYEAHQKIHNTRLSGPSSNGQYAGPNEVQNGAYQSGSLQLFGYDSRATQGLGYVSNPTVNYLRD